MKKTINNNTTGGEHVALHVGGDGIQTVYLLWSLLFGGLLFRALLRKEELGHIDDEGSHRLGQVDLRDFIGLELLMSLSQSCLLRLTQSDGCTHHTRILLK